MSTAVQNPTKLVQNIRKEIGNALYQTTFNRYFEELPLAEINDILAKAGIVMIQEDATEFSGMFCGRDGRTLIELAYKETAHNFCGLTCYVPIENSCLVFEWYKIVTKFEVNMYLS